MPRSPSQRSDMSDDPAALGFQNHDPYSNRPIKIRKEKTNLKSDSRAVKKFLRDRQQWRKPPSQERQPNQEAGPLAAAAPPQKQQGPEHHPLTGTDPVQRPSLPNAGHLDTRSPVGDRSPFEIPTQAAPDPKFMSDLTRHDSKTGRANGSSPDDQDGTLSLPGGPPTINDTDNDCDGKTSGTSDVSNDMDDEEIRAQLPHKWIPTLGMRFRDGSKREKFFVTYIRAPNDWLRVSISVDYENAEEGSLEQDLETLGYQKDKNFVIFKSVRQSLDEISWFPTVTNLRLETLEERLHIHVAEDANERIPYPNLTILNHISLPFHGYLTVDETEVFFDSHLSGFVYKVKVNDQTFVKKEITSTDTVQEFIYEIEALAALRESHSVINLVGIVTNETEDGKVVTGVLIEYASRGALNDFFYDNGDLEVPWDLRLSWIRQVVQGVADIHEAGYVQGDCTLSNVVLDADGNAKIVDINRRGCPIGWEPPEFRGKISSGQRISMYIGSKSDLYQMGMVLWAIATQIEEPDRADRPLTLDDPTTPKELIEVIESCLAEDPKHRRSAKDLLLILPMVEVKATLPSLDADAAMFPTLKDLNEALPSLEDIRVAKDRFFFTHDQGSYDVPEPVEPETGLPQVYAKRPGDLEMEAFGLFDSHDEPAPLVDEEAEETFGREYSSPVPPSSHSASESWTRVSGSELEYSRQDSGIHDVDTTPPGSAVPAFRSMPRKEDSGYDDSMPEELQQSTFDDPVTSIMHGSTARKPLAKGLHTRLMDQYARDALDMFRCDTPPPLDRE